MNFEKLPEGWDREPIHTADRVADVLDLLISERDRRSGGVLVVICDDLGHYVVASLVDDITVPMPSDDKEQLVEVFASATAQLDHRAGVLVAIARADGLSLTADDLEWGAVVQRVCETSGVVMLGVHLVTLHGARPIAA